MKFGQNCKNLSRAVNHLLRCMTIFHPETVDDANSATESQLVLFQSQVCSLLISQNFISVMKTLPEAQRTQKLTPRLELNLATWRPFVLNIMLQIFFDGFLISFFLDQKEISVNQEGTDLTLE